MDIIIEIPKGSHIKYEWDEDRNMLRVDRVLPNHMRYPFHYGFIPNTLAKDGDAYDVILLSHYDFYPNVVLKGHIIGCMMMEDEEGEDPKIIMVPDEKVDRDWGHVKDIDEVCDYKKDRIKHFFTHYKDLDSNKFAKVGRWLNKEETKKLLNM